MKIKLLFSLTFFSLMFVFGLVCCSEQDIDTTLDDTPTFAPKYGPNFKFYTDSNLYQKLQAARSSSNNNFFTIEEVRKDGQNLKIMVNYKGCNDHIFDVVWDGVVNLSKDEKGKINLIMKRDRNAENCDDLISDTIVINLKDYSNELIDVRNTQVTVSNGASIQEVKSNS